MNMTKKRVELYNFYTVHYSSSTVTGSGMRSNMRQTCMHTVLVPTNGKRNERFGSTKKRVCKSCMTPVCLSVCLSALSRTCCIWNKKWKGKKEKKHKENQINKERKEIEKRTRRTLS